MKWQRRFTVGDYLLVTGLGWVEFSGTAREDVKGNCWFGKGILRTDPLPPGHVANEEVPFDFADVCEVVPADQVNTLILSGFVDGRQPIHSDGFAETFVEEAEPLQCGLPYLANVVVIALAVVAAAALGIAAFWTFAP